MAEETQAQENVEVPQAPELSIADILVLKQVVEIATARGAFRAPELTQIGRVYDRVNKWVETVAPAANPEEAETETETEGES